MSKDGDSTSRNAAEWTSFACSCAVLLLVIVLIASQMTGTRSAAAPVVATISPSRVVSDLYHVAVRVENKGDDTAANVQVSAELVINGDVSTGDQTIDFVAGHEEEDLVFVFEDDPDDGELTVSITGFAKP